MRKLFGFVVMCGVLGFVAPGCAVDASEEPPQSSPYGFTRDASGQARPADPVSLENFTAAQEFEHALASEGEQAFADTEAAAAGSCSGACNADTCVCSGDLECCIAGCVICWEVVN